MDDGQNDPNQNTGAPRQAIFTPSNSSTSEQTQPTTPVAPTAPENSTPAAHPYFSSHPTRTFASETGDIILNSDAPRTKTPKKGLIIGLLIFAVVVLIGVIVAVTMTGKPKTSATLTDVVADFNSYRVYLEDGPENTEKVDPDEWFLFQLDEIGLSDEEQVAYTDELQARFEKFRTDFNVAKTGLSDIEGDIIYKYAQIFNLVMFQQNIGNLNLLPASYGSDNWDKAMQLAIAQYGAGNNDTVSGIAAQAVQEYLSAEIDLYNIYGANNCITEGIVDESCVTDLEDPEIAGLVEQRENAYNNYLVNYSALISVFRTQTDEVASLLGDKK